MCHSSTRNTAIRLLLGRMIQRFSEKKVFFCTVKIEGRGTSTMLSLHFGGV
jgi:hypothetical protein